MMTVNLSNLSEKILELSSSPNSASKPSAFPGVTFGVGGFFLLFVFIHTRLGCDMAFFRILIKRGARVYAWEK